MSSTTPLSLEYWRKHKLKTTSGSMHLRRVLEILTSFQRESLEALETADIHSRLDELEEYTTSFNEHLHLSALGSFSHVFKLLNHFEESIRAHTLQYLGDVFLLRRLDEFKVPLEVLHYYQFWEDKFVEANTNNYFSLLKKSLSQNLNDEELIFQLRNSLSIWGLYGVAHSFRRILLSRPVDTEITLECSECNILWKGKLIPRKSIPSVSMPREKLSTLLPSHFGDRLTADEINACLDRLENDLTETVADLAKNALTTFPKSQKDESLDIGQAFLFVAYYATLLGKPFFASRLNCFGLSLKNKSSACKLCERPISIFINQPD